MYYSIIAGNAYHYVSLDAIASGKSIVNLCGQQLWIDYEDHRAFVNGTEIADRIFLSSQIGKYTDYSGRNLLEELFEQAGILK